MVSLGTAPRARIVGHTVMLTFAATMLVVLKSTAAFAACALPSGATAGSCSYSGTGTALTITATNSNGSPYAIEGAASGKNGRGIYGHATGLGGYGGVFQSAARTSNANNTAISAGNSGGSTSTEGNYGSAGVFKITNAKNQSPSVSITTNGINSYGLSVVNSGTIDGFANYAPPYDLGGIAGYFAITDASAPEQSAIYAVTTGGTGTAGTFITSDTTNTTDTLYVETFSPSGEAVYARVGGTGGGGGAIHGYDATSKGGVGVFGQSVGGNSAVFAGGKGGTNNCAYNGGSGWVCTGSGAMMDDRAAPDYAQLLDKLDAMPMAYFHAHGAKVPARELGVSAEDFHAAFGLGPDDGTIAEGNAQGVALAAAKGLYRKLKADEAEIASLKADKAAMADRVARLEATVARLAQGAGGVTQASLAP